MFKPLFYFPSTVILLDDDALFLESMSQVLNPHFLTRAFSSPKQAFDAINTADLTLFDTQGAIEMLCNDEQEDDEHVTLKIRPITHYLSCYNPNRFSLPSVAVIDYTMPEMTGEEFVKQIRGNPIKKIMLTGHKDFSTAVSLFNEGLIDKYIVKDSSDLLDNLKNSITELQYRFFLDQTKIDRQQLQSLGLDGRFQQSAIHSTLQTLKQSHGLCEHYLVEPNKSLLMLNADGTAFWFYLVSEEDIEAFTDVATDNEASDAIIEALRSKHAFPVLTSEAEMLAPVTSWADKLEPLHPIEGSSYYYCLIKGKPLYGLSLDQITCTSSLVVPRLDRGIQK